MSSYPNVLIWTLMCQAGGYQLGIQILISSQTDKDSIQLFLYHDHLYLRQRRHRVFSLKVPLWFLSPYGHF